MRPWFAVIVVSRERLSSPLVLAQYLMLLLTGCALLQDGIIQVADRNLQFQAKYGFGEGLAKGVPSHPLFINNHLYAIGYDVDFGIVLAARKVAETVPLFEQMDNLPLVQWTRDMLSMRNADWPWKNLREFLLNNHQQLILEPYCVLEGYPDAVLLLRIRIVLRDTKKNIWSGQLEESIQKLPLEGEGSWSENNAERLVAMSKNALPAVLAMVPAYFKEKNNMPEVFYRP